MGKGDNEQAEKVMGSCTWLLIILSVALAAIMLLLPGLVQGAQPLLSYNLGA